MDYNDAVNMKKKCDYIISKHNEMEKCISFLIENGDTIFGAKNAYRFKENGYIIKNKKWMKYDRSSWDGYGYCETKEVASQADIDLYNLITTIRTKISDVLEGEKL